MVKSLNPLFPNSDNKGLKGAYEQAVLMDDGKRAYETKNSQPTQQVSITLSKRGKSRKEYKQREKEISQNFHAELKILKRQKRNKEITRAEYNAKSKELV